MATYFNIPLFGDEVASLSIYGFQRNVSESGGGCSILPPNRPMPFGLGLLGKIGMTNSFLNPEKILKDIGVKQEMIVADFGSGAGFFSILAAKIVGEKGKVYALDVQQSALESVRSKAKMEGIFNVETIWCDLEAPNGSKLPTDSVDLVLIANILFQSSKQVGIIKEAKRILKPKGFLAMIEWIPGALMGPKGMNILSKENARELVGSEGLLFEREFDAGAYHYGLLFVK